MNTRIILLLMAALATGSAFAEDAAKPKPFDAGKYSAEVQKAFRYANDECKANGGGDVTHTPGTVTTLDLTGDGRGDFIIQFRPARHRRGLFPSPGRPAAGLFART